MTQETKRTHSDEAICARSDETTRETTARTRWPYLEVEEEQRAHPEQAAADHAEDRAGSPDALDGR